jgi:hypothetical protein
MDPQRILRPIVLFVLFLTFPAVLAAQTGEKKPLDHDAYDIWNRIGAQVISDDGEWLFYTVVPGEGDATLIARNLEDGAEISIPRGSGPRITGDSRFLVFTIEPMFTVVDSLEGEGKRGDDLPKDSLGIVDLSQFQGGEAVSDPDFFRVARVKSWQIPEEDNAFLAYLLEKPEEAPDSAAEGEEEEEEAPRRRPGGRAGAMGTRPGGAGGPGGSDDPKEKEDGTELILRDLPSGQETSFENVMEYAFDEKGTWLAYTAENEDGDADGVFGVATASGEASPVLTGEGKYARLTVSKEDGKVAFLTNRDDWEADDPAYALYYAELGQGEARLVANAETAGVPAGWEVSENGSLTFSEEGLRLFFGTAPTPPPPPTDTLPDDEQVRVDIWNWKDPLIQPMQLVNANRERDRTYQAYASTDDLRVVQLGTLDVPEVDVSNKGEGDVAVATTTTMTKYGWYVSHDRTYVDVYLVDVATGEKEMVLEKLSGRGVSFSPEGRYVTWWDGTKTDWMAMDVATKEIKNLTEELPYPVFDRLDDHPDELRSYRSAGWLEDDEAFLVNDEFDIWALDPTGGEPRNLTEGVGRDNNIRFRYVDPSRGGGGGFFGFRGGGAEEGTTETGSPDASLWATSPSVASGRPTTPTSSL